MEVTIKGQKYLNFNHYRCIRLKSKNNDKIFIDVKSTDEIFMEKPLEAIERIKLSTPSIMDTIKNLNELEKINEIIKYYSRYNNIKVFSSHRGIHCLSTCGSHLDIDLGFPDEFIDNSIEMLKNNYIVNRLKFLDKYKNCKHYLVVAGNESRYSVSNNDDIMDKDIILNLEKDYGDNLRPFEMDFIQNFLLKKIYHENTNVRIYKFMSIYRAYFGNILFDFNIGKSNDAIINLIRNYNAKYEAEESMQLKLDLELGGNK